MNSKQLKKIWRQVPVDYYEVAINRNIIQKVWHGVRWRVLGEMLDLVGEGKILDLGCASGHFTRKIKRIISEAEVVGVDVFEPFFSALGKKKSKSSYVCADAHKLPFRSGSFEVVVCSEMLDHVLDPKAVLLEIRRCLNDGGKLILSLDAVSPLFRIAWFFWTKMEPGKVWKGAHIHKFTRAEIEELFKSTGFILEEMRTTFFGMIVFFKLKKK